MHAAHARNVEERNSQCRHITHNLFSRNWNPYARPAQITVWLGDLNYRIQGIDTYPVRNLIKKDLHRVSCCNETSIYHFLCYQVKCRLRLLF